MNSGATVPAAAQEVGWWQSFKAWYATHLGAHGVFLEGLIAGVLGFFIGFFLGRHGRYFFVMFILLVVVLGVLLNSGLINVEWANVRLATGIDATSTVVDVARSVRDFLAVHRGISVGMLIGLLLGYLSS